MSKRKLQPCTPLHADVDTVVRARQRGTLAARSYRHPADVDTVVRARQRGALAAQSYRHPGGAATLGSCVLSLATLAAGLDLDAARLGHYLDRMPGQTPAGVDRLRSTASECAMRLRVALAGACDTGLKSPPQ